MRSLRALPAEQEAEGLADAVGYKATERDESERREGHEGLVRLRQEQREKRPEDDPGDRERSTSRRPEPEPDEECGAEHHDSERHAARVGPSSDGTCREFVHEPCHALKTRTRDADQDSDVSTR